jgi:putative exosortase-associated protein (TIGR04073 family)
LQAGLKPDLHGTPRGLRKSRIIDTAFIMRKITCIAALLVCLATGSASVCHAEERYGSRSYTGTVGEKFGIGFSNAATGWVEIPKTMYVSSLQEGLASGLTLGFFKGIVNTLGRTFMGVADMTTFMIPTKPMITPPVIWQDFDQGTSYSSTWKLYDTQ